MLSSEHGRVFKMNLAVLSASWRERMVSKVRFNQPGGAEGVLKTWVSALCNTAAGLVKSCGLAETVDITYHQLLEWISS